MVSLVQMCLLVDSDPRNILDPQTDSGRSAYKKLRMWTDTDGSYSFWFIVFVNKHTKFEMRVIFADISQNAVWWLLHWSYLRQYKRHRCGFLVKIHCLARTQNFEMRISVVECYSTLHVVCRNTMSQALDCMKHETEKMAEVHSDLSSQLFSAVQRLTDFINRQKAEIRPVWLT